jgi:hypothetical protein
MSDDDLIKIIKNRIISEHRKHPTLDWEEIASRKILSELYNIKANNYGISKL